MHLSLADNQYDSQPLQNDRRIKVLAHQYQIWRKHWGRDLDPKHQNEKRWIALVGLAKRDRESPNEVFNELVALRLGQIIGLPIPAGLSIENKGKIYFVSCGLLTTGEELPEADLEKFAKDEARLACGIVTFDAWIGNVDRHDENIWYDYYGHKTAVFDHGQSLLGPFGHECLDNNESALTVKTGEYGLGSFVNSMVDFPHWYDRICAIPDSTIKSTCTEASAVGVGETLAKKCASWLINRKETLPQLFKDNKEKLPNLQSTLFDPFGNINDFYPEYII